MFGNVGNVGFRVGFALFISIVPKNVNKIVCFDYKITHIQIHVFNE